jgi:sugar (pentulose or hexulose) kinase
MQKEVIAVFDIGKSNKKILLFDSDYQVVFEEDRRFDEIMDDDDYSCDNIEVIEKWMADTLSSILNTEKYHIVAVNFATYGASLMYLNEAKKRLTPVYNYLKPMPEEVLRGFYDKYDGVNEFSRITASPALDMLNSGLQILWLKKIKPEIFKDVKHVVHFPQYLSLLFTGEVASEYTSIGCHTAMWNFDKQTYHRWMEDEQITLPAPSPNNLLKAVQINGKDVNIGIGIHDSSASIVPYLMSSKENFILISTGTWCIFMNPFNPEPLTKAQLDSDSLCYLSADQKQVKSSRLFLGHIHEVNEKRLSDHFKVSDKAYKTVKADNSILNKLKTSSKGSRVFFKDGVPENYIDTSVDLSIFSTFEEAYHQLMIDLVDLSCKAIELIETKEKDTKAMYISGGFTNNDLYCKLIASRFPEIKVYTSEISNATALGAALVVGKEAFTKKLPAIDLGLIEIPS